jgi:1-deoxy-D-xylulose-5-phosphate reductoisomerase
MAKKIAVIGSTGSIGVNTLRVVETHPEEFEVKVLTAGRNVELLAEQAERFRPALVCIESAAGARSLRSKLPKSVKVVWGEDGLIEASVHPETELALFSVVGGRGLKPLVAAIRARKTVAFANKEPFVMAGELIARLAVKYDVRLLPIDSELSAIFQCLEGRPAAETRRIVLTSSGGPFRLLPPSDLGKVTVRQALEHPRWRMGRKITVDSATLMNKGLEVIETANFFRVPFARIEVLIHPEAIIHSLVEFVDGSHLAQLAVTDMRIPIQYAMTYPRRLDSNGMPRLDFAALKALTFERADRQKFPCLGLGYEAIREGGTLPAVLNAANEKAVELFLEERISFTDIPEKIEAVMRRHKTVPKPGLEDILEADRWARRALMQRKSHAVSS